MLGLFIVRKGLLWSIKNAYCKDGKWKADCILTTFTGIWLKNAGKKKTFSLKGKELLVPFFCLSGCGNILIKGKGYPSTAFYMTGESCFLELEISDGNISSFKGKELNIAIPAEFAMCGMITTYDKALRNTMYILTDFNAYTIKNGGCVWMRSVCAEVLEDLVPTEMKGLLYYGIPAGELRGFTKQITDRGYYII